MSTLRLRNLATLSVEQQLTDNINFDIAIEEFGNKKESDCVENCSFNLKNKDVPNFLHFFNYFSLYVIFAFCLTVARVARCVL